MTDPQPKPSGAWRAVLFLFVLATLIPELLIGSTPLSRIHTLLFQLPYYGSAALVIREAVVRLRLRRAGLILLGVAFGLVTEGLALQSVFNPHFLNLDISFGRADDVNWPWTVYMVGYHALWSVTIPITLAGLVFPERRDERWLGRVGLGLFLLWFVVMAFAFHAIFVKMSGFRAPTGPYAVVAGLVVVLAAVALRWPHRVAPAPAPARPDWLPGTMTLGSGLLWLLLYGQIFQHPPVVPAAWNLLVGLLLAAGFAGTINRWAPESGTIRQRFWFVAGGLTANTIFGFVVVSGSRLDTGGQIGVALLVAGGLYLLWRRLSAGRPGLT